MRLTAFVAAFVLAAGILSAPGAVTAWAADPLDFVVPDNDGYGIADCMKPGMGCGQVIADAWCEAHGHARATAFGLADDVTGAIKVAAQQTPVPPGAVVIHCGE
jgi:hypothetical protein